MQEVLILGVGRSSPFLIDYMCSHAPTYGWQITIGDLPSVVANYTQRQAQVVAFDIRQKEQARLVVRHKHVVISLLPPVCHIEVAKLCIEEGVHLLTASYVSKDIRKLHEEVIRRDLIFLSECGMDPGLDHMSAMQHIHQIHQQGGVITSFESFAGGLIDPETDPQNPWRYKFTWNPRNTVLAGAMGSSAMLDRGTLIEIPYEQLFEKVIPVNVPSVGSFEAYVNRDSLKYQAIYNLQQAHTFVRGTLRYKSFCSAWNILVHVGCCDDSYTLPDLDGHTHRDFLCTLLKTTSPEQELSNRFNLLPNDPAFYKLKWSGFFDPTPIGVNKGTPAQVTEHILQKRWKLNETDRDNVIMIHRIKYRQDDQGYQRLVWLAITGQDAKQTAMAKTVGGGLAMAAKLILQNKVQLRGVVIPTHEEIYNPLLHDLQKENVLFHEQTIVDE